MSKDCKHDWICKNRSYSLSNCINLAIHNLLSEQTMKFGLIVALAYSCLLMKLQENWSICFKVLKGQNQSFGNAVRSVFTDQVIWLYTRMCSQLYHSLSNMLRHSCGVEASYIFIAQCTAWKLWQVRDHLKITVKSLKIWWS